MERKYTKPKETNFKLVKTDNGNVILYEEGSLGNISVLLSKEQKFLSAKNLVDKKRGLQVAREKEADKKVRGSFKSAFNEAKLLVGLENVYIPIRNTDNSDIRNR